MLNRKPSKMVYQFLVSNGTIFVHSDDTALLYSLLMIFLYSGDYEEYRKFAPIWNKRCEQKMFYDDVFWCGLEFDEVSGIYHPCENYDFLLPFYLETADFNFYISDFRIAFSAQTILEYFGEAHREELKILRSGMRKNRRLYNKFGVLAT